MNPSDIGLPPHFKFFRDEVKQLETILTLSSSPNRYSLVSAPPGSGKTLMAITPAIINGWRILYLTSTKAQSLQVYRDFASIGLTDIVGHVNYSCARSSFNSSDLSDFDFECSAKEDGSTCYYRDKIDLCLTKNFVSTNYAHWTSILKSDDPNRLGKFDLIILDEAHKLVSDMVDFIKVTVNPRYLSHFLEMKTPSEDDPISIWKSFIREAVSKIRFISSRKKWNDDSVLTKKDLVILAKVDKDLSRFLLHCDSSEWVVETDHKSKSLVLSPVWPMHFTERYLFHNIPRVIAVSATINEDTAKYLGIPEDNRDYIEVDSSFPKERRPFIYIPTVLVDYRMTHGQKKILVDQFDRVIEGRLDRKGVIQCISYEKGLEVQSLSKFKNDKLFITDTKYAVTQELLTDFINSSPPSLFNSPAIEEGIDLPDDHCRYQIIYKMPAIDGRGKIIQARVKEDKGYKLYVMSQRLEQMYGRPTRSKKDWSETFIFDDYFYRYKRQVKWHKWFIESWVKYSAVPKALNF